MKVDDLTPGIGLLDGSVAVLGDVDDLGSVNLVRKARPPVNGLRQRLKPTREGRGRIPRRKGKRLVTTVRRGADKGARIDVQSEEIGR